jgi:two-component system, chemotaxis family, chemotaxis protein CheY
MSFVLVVEDNLDLRLLYRTAMESEGYKVQLAANGREALEVLRSTKTPPKVILLDLMMPEMDGWEFLEIQAKDQTLSDIPVVVCSAARENIPANVRFIRKPVLLDDLVKLAKEFC